MRRMLLVPGSETSRLRCPKRTIDPDSDGRHQMGQSRCSSSTDVATLTTDDDGTATFVVDGTRRRRRQRRHADLGDDLDNDPVDSRQIEAIMESSGLENQ